METSSTHTTPTAQELTSMMLHELGIAIHRHGYNQLQVAIPHFAQDVTQSLTKDLYPYVGEQLGGFDRRAVERSIRCVIIDSWLRRNPDTWNKYFPEATKSPSNKQFIATLAERIK